MIIVGIDDTDIKGSPGTNQLAREIVERLGAAAVGSVILRHQLFFDPRVPYTSQNGSASIQLPAGDAVARDRLIAVVRDTMCSWFIEGSDPGLAVADTVTDETMAFAARAKEDVVTQSEARAVAARAGCVLEGLGGTNQGIIGALAAVALAYGGNDGRVVHIQGWPWPDALSGIQPVSAIRERGVTGILTTSGEPFTGNVVDIGKHLRPSWRGGRPVLFVNPETDINGVARAARLK